METSEVMRSMDDDDGDDDAEVLLLLLLLISNGAIVTFAVAVCVGELLARLKSLDKKSNDKQLSDVMSLVLLDDSALEGSLLLNFICLLFGRMDRMASSVSKSESLSRRFCPVLILFEL